MIPSVERKEWAGLITGKDTVKLSCFSLKMKISSLNMGYKTGLMSLDEAIDDLHAMCLKYEKLFKEDIKRIFNN